jgi:enoyl-CoA hydratase
MPVHATVTDDIVTLVLELGRGNAIDDAFIAAVNDALDDAEASPARAVVLTGHGRTFCGGLDLLRALALDRAALSRFVDSFDGLFLRVFAFPKPLVAAVNGHALAGGCLLALAADHRVMAPGPFFIGLNEVPLGIPLPAGCMEIVRAAVPPTSIAEALIEGRRYSPEEAARAGLVHRVAVEGAVVAEAQAKARSFAKGGADAVRDVKHDLAESALARAAAHRDDRRERFLDRWLAPDAQARMGAIRDELLRKRAG